MRCLFASILVIPVLCLGCSRSSEPDLVPVKGKVLYQGKPVPNATVMFVPKNAGLAMGTTNDQGEFTLATKGRTGAVPGDHRVAVSAMEVSPKSAAPEIGSPEYLKMMSPGASKPPKSLIPEKFGKVETSGLTQKIDADASKNDLTVDLGT